MRLFYQLTPSEKTAVMKFCTDLVLKDIITGDLSFDLETDDENIKRQIQSQLEYIDTLEYEQEKIEHLLGNHQIADLISETAREIAQSAIYTEPDQLVICPEALENAIPQLPAGPASTDNSVKPSEQSFVAPKDPKTLN